MIGPEGPSGAFDPQRAGCRLIVDDGLSLKIVTLAGGGISINSLWSVHRELVAGSLVRVLPQHEIDERPALWLVYPKSNVLAAKVRIFIDFLIEKIAAAPLWAGQ